MTAREQSLDEAADDIQTMRVRGAGKIARHAVRALAHWEATAAADTPEAFDAAFRAAVARLVATRPTAVSLRNGLRFVQARVAQAPTLDAKRHALRQSAGEFEVRSKRALVEIGRNARAILREGGTYLTHCNSQAAIEGFRQAAAGGMRLRVLACETRPWGQGYITARELAEAGVDATLVVDSAAASLMRDVDGVFVGCDTIAANGDVVNKVGTFAHALSARHHDVPFHVCGESYKVALDIPTGRDVVIEERDTREVVDLERLGGAGIRNPVFDATPAALITRIITELGALAPAEVAPAAAKAWR